jgi:hypothetical protein
MQVSFSEKQKHFRVCLVVLFGHYACVLSSKHTLHSNGAYC